jgi:hypothetical protein
VQTLPCTHREKKNWGEKAGQRRRDAVVFLRRSRLRAIVNQDWLRSKEKALHRFGNSASETCITYVRSYASSAREQAMERPDQGYLRVEEYCEKKSSRVAKERIVQRAHRCENYWIVGGERGERLTRAQGIGWSLVAWLAVGVFWLIATKGSHPTWGLALITTSTLVSAYAAAAYVNHLALVPRYWRAGRYGNYAVALGITMATLTAVGLAVIRTCYFLTLGPDPDPNGVYVHYAIDFIGMAFHLSVAAGVVWCVGRLSRS